MITAEFNENGQEIVSKFGFDYISSLSIFVASNSTYMTFLVKRNNQEFILGIKYDHESDEHSFNAVEPLGCECRD